MANKKRVLDKTKLVKEKAREEIGTPPSSKVIPNKKKTTQKKKKLTKEELQEEEAFDHAIGHYSEYTPGVVVFYTYFTEIHRGTMKTAQEYLEYVKEKCPKHEWKIFKVIEL